MTQYQLCNLKVGNFYKITYTLSNQETIVKIIGKTGKRRNRQAVVIMSSYNIKPGEVAEINSRTLKSMIARNVTITEI